jgi:8-oxo-dGTP pyrophosphatase MutT (NUDIX family)
VGPRSGSGAASTVSAASRPEPTPDQDPPGRPLPSGGPGGDAAVRQLRAALESHQPCDQREELSLAIILDELARLDRPFDRLADPTHVTTSAFVVGPRGVILLRHRRLHRWLQPGGHVEPGERPAEAAVRECAEETGLPVVHPPSGPNLIHVDVHPAAQGHIHLDLRYLLWAPDRDPAPGPGESQEVAWFSWESAAVLADDALAGGLASARRLARAWAYSTGSQEPSREDEDA